MRYAVIAAVVVAAAFTQTVAPPNSYVDAARCAQCHAAIASSFKKNGMGRSFSRVNTREAAQFYHEASDTHFAMLERDGKYYQRRWQIGFDGKETNVEEKSADYMLGSGNHGRTYLHLTKRNTLQQLPLGWYAAKGGYWAMNPGYDRAEYQGSTRVIHYECMSCHNGYSRIPAGHQEAGAEAKYLQPIPEGIDCQRCHGPGQRHIQAVGKPGTIVNPARLSAERELEVCMQCHLETSSRKLPHSIQRFGRGPFSYVPGQPLGDFRLAFDRAPGKNEDFEVAHQAYRLRDSQCFLKSEGKLRCTTCHKPHDTAAANYNAACASCHAAAHKPSPDCVSCHMPMRRTDDAVHIVMTDHKIVRRPPAGDLLAEKKEKHESTATSYRGEVVPYYPAKLPMTAENQLYIALAQVTDRSNLEAGLTRLAGLLAKSPTARSGFYAGLGEGYRAAGDNAKAIAALEEAARRAPSSEIVALQLGNALMESAQWAKAEVAFRRAKTLRPDDAAAWGLLGWVSWQQNRTAEAKSSLETGIQLDPDSPDLHNYLALLLMGTGDVAGAEREFREAVRINPGIAEWRVNLGTLLAARGQVAEAEYHARAAVRADASLASGHELWGRLLAARDDFAAAVPKLQEAVRLKPDSWLAHYELGVALARLGRIPAAIEHLRRAAQGTNVQARTAAQQVLRSLGQ